jgi:orotidine-5'-phosphate decarboxylase
MMKPAHPLPELIVALDLPTRAAAQRALQQLPASVRHVKIGLELFIGEGPAVLSDAAATGRRCFLDLKLHDIPRTVAHAVRSAAAHNVFMLTVHAKGGEAMLKAAAEAAAACGAARPRVIAVTTLTSLNQDDLTQLGITRPLAEHTLALGKLAIASGCDGLVCSPLELAMFRRELGPAPLLVAPGIRPSGAATGDQKRVASPADAVRAGASFLVVGRPILEAQDPSAAAESVLQEMQAAWRQA